MRRLGLLLAPGSSPRRAHSPRTSAAASTTFPAASIRASSFAPCTAARLKVGLFADVNAWKNLRWWFTESELVYWGGFKKIPVMALDPGQLWEYDPDAPNYYRDRNRALPPEVVAVVNHTAASGKPASSSK